MATKARRRLEQNVKQALKQFNVQLPRKVQKTLIDEMVTAGDIAVTRITKLLGPEGAQEFAALLFLQGRGYDVEKMLRSQKR